MRLVLFILLAAQLAGAANVYIRDGATGAGTSWSDALDDLPATLTRGDTYYIADGSYAAYTFNDAPSGTTLITIKKATVADHGTSTGWSDTYGDGQASWGHVMVFETDYYMFDGVAGSGAGTNNYGFQVLSQTPTLEQLFVSMGSGTGVDPSFITISHVAFLAPTNDVQKIAIGTHSQSFQTNLTVSHCFFDGLQNAVNVRGVNLTMEHCYAANGWSSPSHHGEQVNLRLSGTQPCTNYVIRYNTFTNCTGTGVIVGNNAGADEYAADGVYIYGNVFDGCTSGGNGIITTTTAGYWKNIRVYNNTFAGGSTLWFSDCQAGASTAIKAASTGFFLTNNLIYGRSAAIGDNADGALDHDYNSFFDCTNIPTESSGQTATGSPFTSTTDGLWVLSTDTSTRTSLGGSYDTDANGNTFTSSRGWKQISGGASSVSFVAAPGAPRPGGAR